LPAICESHDILQPKQIGFQGYLAHKKGIDIRKFAKVISPKKFKKEVKTAAAENIFGIANAMQ